MKMITYDRVENKAIFEDGTGGEFVISSSLVNKNQKDKELLIENSQGHEVFKMSVDQAVGLREMIGTFLDCVISGPHYNMSSIDYNKMLAEQTQAALKAEQDAEEQASSQSGSELGQESSEDVVEDDLTTPEEVGGFGQQ